MTTYRFQRHIISLAVMFGLWLLISPRTVVVQTNCQPPAISRNYAWPQGAQVRVYVDPTYSEEQKQGIKTALTNWNNANGPSGNNSGVFFILPPLSTPISGVNTMQVINQPPPGCLTCAGTTGGDTTGTNRTDALISLNGNIMNTSSSWQAANVMAHEVGHTFGLANCTTCTCGNPQGGSTQNASVMSENCGQGQSVSPQGPTPCDNQKANEVGQYGSGGGDGGGDGGAGGGEGDCYYNSYNEFDNCDGPCCDMYTITERYCGGSLVGYDESYWGNTCNYQ